MDPDSLRKMTGLFGAALRIAFAADDSERQAEKQKLRKRMPAQLFRWIDDGHYGYVAYMLYSLFPQPDGAPSRLIESCWQIIGDKVVEAAMKKKLSQGRPGT